MASKINKVWIIAAAGYAFTNQTDESLSASRFSGNGFSPGIGARFEGARLQHELLIKYQFYTLRNHSNSTISTKQQSLDASYALDFSVGNRTENNFRFFAGPQLSCRFTSLAYNALLNNSGTIERFIALQVSGRVVYKITEVVSITDRLSLPIAAYLYRKPALSPAGNVMQSYQSESGAKSSSTLGAIPDLAMYCNRISLAFTPSDKHSIGISYLLQYSRIGKQTKSVVAAESLTINYAYSWR